MVEKPRGETFAPPRRGFDMRDLSRVATWGLVTLGALTIAAYAASSEVGEDRLIVAVANFRGVPPPERLARAPLRQADAPARHHRSRVVRRPRAIAGTLGHAGAQRQRRHRIYCTGREPAGAAPAPAILPPVVSAPDVVTAAPAVIAPDPPPARSDAAGAVRRTRRPQNRIRRRPWPRKFGRRIAPALEHREGPARRRAGGTAAHRGGARDCTIRRCRGAACRRPAAQCRSSRADLRAAARLGLSSDGVRRATARVALTITA